MTKTLWQVGYDDAINGEEPFCDLNADYMQGYNAGTWAYYTIDETLEYNE